MPDFSVRADHIDVEQIMRQIRTRIRDKRGADYTEAEIRELASVKLDKFLDPRAVRSDLLLHYRRERQPTPLIQPEEAHPPLYNFDHQTVYVSDRGAAGKILTLIRKILKPISKLFFHVDTVWDVLTKQSRLNTQHVQFFQRIHQRLLTRDELDSLNFEMFNNLVVEITRLGIENKNLRMQVESFGTRLDFDERRSRALEGVVQYKPGAPVARPPQEKVNPSASTAPGSSAATEDDEDDDGTVDANGESRSARRRRRRRGRRRGQGPGGPGEGGSGEGGTGEGAPGAEASGFEGSEGAAAPAGGATSAGHGSGSGATSDEPPPMSAAERARLRYAASLESGGEDRESRATQDTSSSSSWSESAWSAPATPASEAGEARSGGDESHHQSADTRRNDGPRTNGSDDPESSAS